MSEPLSEDDPREVGQYQLVARLGAGATGVVYEAMSRSGERVAVKVLHPFLVNSPGIRERLKREGTALRQVSGVRAVRVLEVDSEGPKPFLAMELVEGQTLSDYVNTFGAVRGAMMWALAEGLAEALSDIHDAGIVHRDLKPSNVLLGPDGVRVVDFGISILADATSLTGTGSFVGTAAWLSPEQVQGDEVTDASDIFSLGMLLAYASAGQHPFGSGRSDAVMYRIIHSEPALDDVPNALRSIVTGCLTKSPLGRLSLEEIRGLLSEADKSNSSETESADSRHTRVVSKDEQVQALIGSAESEALGEEDREVLYDLSAWSLESRARLTDAFKLRSVGYRLEGDELVVEKSDEDRADEIIEYVPSQLNRVLNPLAAVFAGSLPAVEKPAGYSNSTRNRFLGLVAAVFLVGGVVIATNQSSGNTDGISTAATSKNQTDTTIAKKDDRGRNLRSALTGFDSQMIEELEGIEMGEEYSEILQNSESALVMTDIIQTECRGRWIINETLERTGMSTLLYDGYFSNTFGVRDYPSRHIATKVAVTVLRNPYARPEAFAQGALGVLGGYQKSCNDEDFSFQYDAGIDACAYIYPSGAWSMVTADTLCLKSALRSIPGETDSVSSKKYDVTLDNARWGAQGDSLVMAGKGSRIGGGEETSMILLVWVDLSGEFAVVVRSHATNFDSGVSSDDLDERASAAMSNALGLFFRVAMPVIGPGSD